MPYFCPSRGLQVRGLIKTSREPTELNTHSIRYEPWNMRPQASSMQDRCAEIATRRDRCQDSGTHFIRATSHQVHEVGGSLIADNAVAGAINIMDPKGRWQLQGAMTIPGYNDTSA